MIQIPVESCSRQGRQGKRWGEGGKCYHGKGAEEKAKAQGQAIEASKHANELKEDCENNIPQPFERDGRDFPLSNLILHTNDVKITGKPIFEDADVIVVPVLLTEEGVHNNGLKDWDTLYDPKGLEGYAWFERRPIVDGHPGVAVNHAIPKYGFIQNVEPDPETRTVPAEAVLFKRMFSENELTDIRNGTWKGVSIGYYCNEIKESGVFKGIPYDHREVGPLYADHVALVKNPACKRCGINTNSLCTNCGKCKKITEGQPAPTGKEGAPAAGGAEPPAQNEELKGLGTRAVTTLDKKLKLNQIPEEIAIKAKTILGLQDDYAKGKAALDLLLEIAIMEEEEEGPAGSMEGNSQKEPPKKNEKTEENAIMKGLEPLVNSINSLTDVVNTLKADSDKAKTELETLKQKEAARENEIRANEEKRLSDSLRANFDPAYQMDWDKKHWPVIKQNGINVFLANKEHAKHYDPLHNELVEVNPVGQSFSVHEDSSHMPRGWKMTSIQELAKMQYPGIEKETGKA